VGNAKRLGDLREAATRLARAGLDVANRSLAHAGGRRQVVLGPTPLQAGMAKAFGDGFHTRDVDGAAVIATNHVRD